MLVSGVKAGGVCVGVAIGEAGAVVVTPGLKGGKVDAGAGAGCRGVSGRARSARRVLAALPSADRVSGSEVRSVVAGSSRGGAVEVAGTVDGGGVVPGRVAVPPRLKFCSSCGPTVCAGGAVVLVVVGGVD